MGAYAPIFSSEFFTFLYAQLAGFNETSTGILDIPGCIPLKFRQIRPSSKIFHNQGMFFASLENCFSETLPTLPPCRPPYFLPPNPSWGKAVGVRAGKQQHPHPARQA
jgi:hypothetical protein